MLALITGGRVESEKASFKKLQVYLSKEHRKEHKLKQIKHKNITELSKKGLEDQLVKNSKLVRNPPSVTASAKILPESLSDHRTGCGKCQWSYNEGQNSLLDKHSLFNNVSIGSACKGRSGLTNILEFF